MLIGIMKQHERILDIQLCASSLLLRTLGQGGLRAGPGKTLRAQLASPAPTLPCQSSPWRLTLWAPVPCSAHPTPPQDDKQGATRSLGHRPRPASVALDQLLPLLADL